MVDKDNSSSNSDLTRRRRSCEMCGKQDFTPADALSPKNKRTHFYFHKSDESSDSNDDNGDLSWSGEPVPL